MKATLKAAGITPAEFALMVGVSRIAVYNWLAGRSKPHQLLEDRVRKALALLKHLVEKKQLPLRGDLDRAVRREKIDKLKTFFETYSKK